MTKEAIVTLVRSIQVGVSDDGDEAMEEEEDESDAPHEPEVASPANAAPTAQSATPVKAPETSKKTVGFLYERFSYRVKLINYVPGCCRAL